MSETNVKDFLGELNGGMFIEKLAYQLSDTALNTIRHNNGSNKKGKVTIEFSFTQVGENEQVIVNHKLSHSTPTKRGKRSEEDETETPMFVGKGGKLSVSPPKEDDNGQFALDPKSQKISPINS